MLGRDGGLQADLLEMPQHPAHPSVAWVWKTKLELYLLDLFSGRNMGTLTKFKFAVMQVMQLQCPIEVAGMHFHVLARLLLVSVNVVLTQARTSRVPSQTYEMAFWFAPV